MKTFIEAIGYRLGQKASQARNAFELMGGTEEESLRAEIRLGRDLATALLERVPLAEDNEITRFVVQIGQWLAASVKERKLPFSFRVTVEREPVALALPGGPVFVSWSLLAICKGERDEIAFLLAHEMGHVVLRHAVDRLVQDAAVSLLLRRSSGKLAATSWLNKVGQQLLHAAYSHEDELRADAFGAALIRTAGGDPSACMRLLEKLEESSVAASGSYFSTHPQLQQRIAHLRDMGRATGT